MPFSLIRYDHFNQFRNSVGDAVGIGDNGFGITSILTREVNSGWRAAADHWSSLIKGLDAIYMHQKGVHLLWSGTNLINYSLYPNKNGNLKTGLVISENFVNFLNSTATTVASQPARFIVSSTQLSNLVTENGISVRTTPWTTSISHVVKLSWLTTATARYFFNLGGYISLDATHAANSSAPEDLAWQSLIDGLTTATYTRSDYVNASPTKFYPLVNGIGLYSNYQYDIVATRNEDNRSITFNINFSTSGTSTQVVGPSIIVIPNAATWVLGSSDPTSFVPIASLPAAGTYSDQSIGNNVITLTVANNGSLTISSTSGSAFTNSSWGSPIIAGAGNNYWVRFTLQSNLGSNTRSTTPSTGWLQLSSDRSVVVSSSSIGQLADSNQQSVYLVEISSNSLGTVIVSSGTFNINSSAVANLFSPINPLYGSDGTYSEVDIGQIEVQMVFYPNGELIINGLTTGNFGTAVSPLDAGNWGSPTTSDAGANYWIRATLNSETSLGPGTTNSSLTTGWVQLNSQFVVYVLASTGSSLDLTTKEANYTIDIATDSLGNNIVASGTYTLVAQSASAGTGGGGGGGSGYGQWVQDPFTGEWYFVVSGNIVV